MNSRTNRTKDVYTLKVGQKIRDNDPRMKGRVLTITAIWPNGVSAKDAAGSERVYLRHRIFTDNKQRKYGMNLLYTFS